jgi:hypothetical protein
VRRQPERLLLDFPAFWQSKPFPPARRLAKVVPAVNRLPASLVLRIGLPWGKGCRIRAPRRDPCKKSIPLPDGRNHGPEHAATRASVPRIE